MNPAALFFIFLEIVLKNFKLLFHYVLESGQI